MSTRPAGQRRQGVVEPAAHVALMQLDAGQVVQVAPGVRDRAGVALDGRDGARGTDPLGQGRREQPDTAVEVQRPLPRLRVELVQDDGHEGRGRRRGGPARSRRR